jgi:hypothetical protein
MSDDGSPVRYDPDLLVALARERLEQKPDANLTDRVCLGVVIAIAGKPENECTFPMVAEIVGCSVEDVHQALLASREAFEAGVS